MKNSDENIKINTDITGNAQADDRSELLPIYDMIKTGGDFQPLEDIEEPEYIAPDIFGGAADAEKSGADKIKKRLRKQVPFFTDSDKFKRRIIVVAAAVLLVAAAVIVCKVAFAGGSNTSGVEVVYGKDDRSTVLRLDDGREYDIGNVSEVKASDDGLVVYYSSETRSKSGAYDLYCLKLDRKKSLFNSEKLVATGIEDRWSITADGSYCSYCISEPGINQFYMYSLIYGKTEQIADDIEEIFLPPTGSTVYFTRRNGAIYSLHRKNFSERSQSVASSLDYVRAFSDGSDFEILYTQKTGSGEKFNIWTVTGTEDPKRICTNVDEAYINDYSVGGNLYYFEKSKALTDWRDFVEDDYYDEDLKITKPEKNDYIYEKGFIFKRMVLDSTAYGRDLEKYNAKTARDNVREALDIYDTEGGETEEYICSFYNRTVSKKLASGVCLDNICAVSPTGSPKILYRKPVLPVDSKIKIEKLAEMAEKDGLAATMDYVRHNVSRNDEKSTKNVFCIYDDSTVRQLNVEGYDGENTDFILATRTEFYAVNANRLYCSKISGDKILPAQLISEKVTDYESDGKNVYFMSIAADGTQSLCRFNPEDGKTELSVNVSSYFLCGSGRVIIFSGDSAASDTLSISLFDGEKVQKIDENVISSDFMFLSDKMIYKKSTVSADEPGNGEGYIYSFDGEKVKFSDSVKNIKYFK